MKRISIIIPAHNEEERLKKYKILESYLDFFRRLRKEKKLDFEIVIVLNACTDKTRQVVEDVIRKKKAFREIRILEFKEAGKGFAITRGFKDALKRKNDLIGFVDADHSTPAKAFYDLVKKIGRYDGVIADRWSKRSKIRIKQPLIRRILSRGYNLMVRLMFHLSFRDTQCGAKLFKREILEKRIHLMKSSQWGYDVALLFCLKKGGAKIKAVPTIWNDAKKSKVDIIKTLLKMFISLIRLRLMHSPFKFIVRLYNRLPEKLKIHNKF